MGSRLVSFNPERREMVIQSDNETLSYNLGRKIGTRLLAGSVLSLSGDLGAGKTVLVRGIAAGLGCLSRVVSPTFTLLMEHETRNNLLFCHFDVYRLAGEAEFTDAGLDEYLGRDDTICVIEWGDIISDVLPADTIHICMRAADPQNPDMRLITIKWPESADALAAYTRSELEDADTGS